jgi:hypothetical protein
MKKKDNFLEDIKPSFGLAAGSVGMGMLGKGFASTIPAGMNNPFYEGASAMGGFVPVAANIGGSSIVIKQIKKLFKK